MQQNSYESSDWDTISEHQNSDQSSLKDKIQQLTNSYQLFKNYILSLQSNVKSLPIRNDILQHLCCNEFKDIKQDTILEIATMRLNKIIKNKKVKKNWNKQDLKILIWIMSKHADSLNLPQIQMFRTQDWKYIASMIPGVNQDSCQFKWLSLQKAKISAKNWTPEQSKQLCQIINQLQPNSRINWTQIAQKLYRLDKNSNKYFRSGKKCRQHWICYLNPKLKKGPWSKQQDNLLMNSIKNKKGIKKWSQIVHLFDGRTENALKNRFDLLIKKVRNLSKIQNAKQLFLIDYYLETNYVNQFTTKIQNLNTEEYLQQDQIVQQKTFNNNQQRQEKPDIESKKFSNIVLASPNSINLIIENLYQYKPCIVKGQKYLMNIEYVNSNHSS